MSIGPLRAVGVIVAGGTGTRLGSDRPKQLLELAGRPMLARVVATLQSTPGLDEFVVVAPRAHLEESAELVRAAAQPVRVIEGGATRAESVRRALLALGPQERNVLVHDAARPLVTSAILAGCLAALDGHAAVTAAVAMGDTVLVADEGFVTDVPERSRLWRAQTPQGFRLSVLRRAHERAERDPTFTATDDAGVVLRYCPEVPIAVVPGSEDNLKVTHPADLALAEALLRRQGGG